MNTVLFLRAVEEAHELDPGELCAAWERGAAAGLERAKHFTLAIDAERGTLVVVRKEEGTQP